MMRRALLLPFALLPIACQAQPSAQASVAANAASEANAVAEESVAPAAAQTAAGGDVSAFGPEGEISIDKAVRPVRLADGSALTLTPVRIVGRLPGITAQCGVLIDGQAIVTIGLGDLEAYGCRSLVEAGPLSGDRIGLIYDVSSPNVSFRTALILAKDAAGKWAIDPASIGTYDDKPEAKSIAAFAKAVAR
jgi:hypothetical protein